MAAVQDPLAGHHPSITPAHVLATVIAGIPIIAHLLAAFGIYSVSEEEQEALSDAMTWAGVLATAIVAGDTGLRASRNAAVARVVIAGAGPGAAVAPAPAVAVAPALPAAPAAPTASDEPGDVDALPHIAPANPEEVPPDQGDAKTAVVTS